MSRKPKKDNFWTNGFSIDETRVSVLIMLLWMFSVLAAYMTVKNGDVPINVVQVLIALITAIAGVNIADSIANRNGSLPYTGQPYAEPLTRPLDDDQKPTI